MRLPLAAAAAILTFAAQRAAASDARPETSRDGPGLALALGLRLAVAPALGSAAADVPVSEAVPVQVPVQLDGMLESHRLAAGVYGSWGWGRVDGCPGSCGASVWRAGLQATWTFAPIRGGDPWAGAAVGYEWAQARRGRDGTEVETSWRGWELFAAQGGVEWRVSPSMALGPFVLIGVGRYTDVSVDTGFESASASIPERAVHGWIHVGVRARFRIEVRP